MRRRGYNLVPADPLAEDDMLELPDGPFMVSIRQPRSIPHHRLYFACLNSICKSGGFDDGPEILHDVTKMGAGCFRVIHLQGLVYRVPDSTAFARMDQIAFTAFFNRALAFWQSEGLWKWLAPDLKLKLDAGERIAA
jgi:hypothetical protein